jgi:tRNA1(Val) A37 N6-methylase TrmN6
MTIYRTKNDLQNLLNVSGATIDKWIKTGVIPEAKHSEGYDLNEFESIIRKIHNDTSRLQQRVNRTLSRDKLIIISGSKNKAHKTAITRAADIHNSLQLSIEHSIFSLAVQILVSHRLIGPGWDKNPCTRIERFLAEWAEASKIGIKNIEKIYEGFDFPDPSSDFLGSFYQSLQSVSQKSVSGSYYTPGHLLESIVIQGDKTILDPFCGSGSILLKILTKDHDPKKIHAYDTDDIALKICRINLHVHFNDPDICPNIINKDIILDNHKDLNHETDKEFDFIVTNPPWGARLKNSDKKKLLELYPELNTTETFSIALKNSIELLKNSGSLVFFLPYSFLNIETHKGIRKYITDQRFELSITLLGNAFKGVMSEAIRIDLIKNSRSEYLSVLSSSGKNKTTIDYSDIKNQNYKINANANSAERDIINKIYAANHGSLKGRTTFGLGIVTGENTKHILNEPTLLSEPIFRGKDIHNFRFGPAECHIELQPKLYQQICDVELFRRPKIAYRFISNKIICAADKKGRLLLNSANMLIPDFDIPIETLACLLNSKLYTFLYRKKFNSKKLLRSHLESFPIPDLSNDQHGKFLSLHDEHINGKKNFGEINTLVYEIFSLNTNEMDTVESCK